MMQMESIGTQVACGECHSLALSAAGTVYAWGDNTDRKLGTGTPGEDL